MSTQLPDRRRQSLSSSSFEYVIFHARLAPANGSSIVATYHKLLASDADLTKPMAAIESLIALLNAVPSSTVYETLESVKVHANRLRASVANPVPAKAGTDLFIQYLVASLKEQEGSFEATRAHLLKSGRLFIDRAIEARRGVAEAGWQLIQNDMCVLTHGASRSVMGLLEIAAQRRQGKFRVVYVRDGARPAECDDMVRQLRALEIPVAEIPLDDAAYVMCLLRQVDRVFVGAEAVTQDGGIISRISTLLLAQLANSANIPFHVAAETYKFCRKFPLNQRDLDFTQNVLDFSTDKASKHPEDPVAYTVSCVHNWKLRTDEQPHKLITNIITENGVKPTTYVIEQLLNIYGNMRWEDAS